jgi:hypothetical protein
VKAACVAGSNVFVGQGDNTQWAKAIKHSEEGDQFTDGRRVSPYLADIAPSKFLLSWSADAGMHSFSNNF